MILQIDRKEILEELLSFELLEKHVNKQTPEEKAKIEAYLLEMAEQWIRQGKSERVIILKILRKLKKLLGFEPVFSEPNALKLFSYSGTLKETLVIRC